eukprot:SAG31_NODE_3616_length_4066_cov_1.641543_4_plen_50_part_00
MPRRQGLVGAAALAAGECDWIISRWSGNKERTHACTLLLDCDNLEYLQA